MEFATAAVSDFLRDDVPAVDSSAPSRWTVGFDLGLADGADDVSVVTLVDVAAFQVEADGATDQGDRRVFFHCFKFEFLFFRSQN